MAFREAVLDEDGTIQAGINLLHRAYVLKKCAVIDPREFGSRMPVLRLEARRSEELDRLDLFVIAAWWHWNRMGILWDERFYDAQNNKAFPCNMGLDGFKKHCKRGLGLRYRPKKQV